MVKQTDNNSDLFDRINKSTQEVRGNNDKGQDTLLFLNTQYETFPVILQQETLISGNAKNVYNNLWIWAKTKQAGGSIQASLFPGYDYIQNATGFERGTIASCMTQLRLQRYLTFYQKVRNEKGHFVGNDLILNDEPMCISDTLMMDKDFVQFVMESQKHRHKSVQHLANLVKSSIELHISKEDDPLRPSTHIEKIETRQQAAQIIQDRLFPESKTPSSNNPTHYFGIPIEQYQSVINQVHKVNSVENDEFDQVHKVNSVENHHNEAENTQVHKVNSVTDPENVGVHKVNSVVNEEVNSCSSGFYINTTTTGAEFTEEIENLIYPVFETSNELAICKLHIAKLDPEHRQPILDELAARMNSNKLEKLSNPIGYLKGWLIKRLEEGEIPYTSLGAKFAALRNNPPTESPVETKKNKEQIKELSSEIQHFNRLIGYQEKMGNDPHELVNERDEKQGILDSLLTRDTG